MLRVALPEAAKLAFGVVLGQVWVTLVAALAAYAVAGSSAGLAAASGGGIGTLATLVMAVLVVRGARGSDALGTVRAFFLGEFAKLALTIALFVVALKWTPVSPLPLLAGYGATFMVPWIVLARRALDGWRAGATVTARSMDAGTAPRA